MLEQGERPARRRRRWPFYLLSILAAVSLLLHAAKFRRGREIAERQRQYSELVRTKPITETKARRARFYRLQYFLGYPMAASYAVADLIRRVDAITPPLQLLAIQVDPGLHDMSFELSVGIAAVGPREAQRRLAAFLVSLRSIPGVFQVESSIQAAAVGDGKQRVFVVSGRAELP